jgi:hypothetical protein
MGVYKKALILVHRNENADDFQQIARRIRKLDPTIGVTMFSDFLTSKMLPPEYLNLPMLVIYLCNPPSSEFKVATKLAVKETSKIDEYAHFKQHNILCLPIERFKWGMALDPAIYGDWVVLKPEFKNSTGRDINMLPTALLPTLTLDDFPANHLIREDTYLVQKFIKTGETPVHYRVTIFLNEILFSSKSCSKFQYPQPNLTCMLSTTVASNIAENRTTQLYENEEINNFALVVSNTFPVSPLLGIDILQDELTKQLYVLEVNAGGNVWHFSSTNGENYRFNLGGKNAMVRQYNAWDRAAEALVRNTHALAR